jgi:hypothetical protein
MRALILVFHTFPDISVSMANEYRKKQKIAPLGRDGMSTPFSRRIPARFPRFERDNMYANSVSSNEWIHPDPQQVAIPAAGINKDTTIQHHCLFLMAWLYDHHDHLR